MTLPEFFGGVFLVFGPPLAMFILTIAHDPIRIIVLVAAAFIWLCSVLLSSLAWFLITRLGTFTIVGVVTSIFIQVNGLSDKLMANTEYSVLFCYHGIELMTFTLIFFTNFLIFPRHCLFTGSLPVHHL